MTVQSDLALSSRVLCDRLHSSYQATKNVHRSEIQVRSHTFICREHTSPKHTGYFFSVKMPLY